MATDIAQDIQSLAQLAQEKLGTRGQTLEASLTRTRGLLPRHLRRKARALTAAEPLADHPRLHIMVDDPALHRTADELQAYLKTVNPTDRKVSWWLGWGASLAFNILLFVALLIAVLHWQGRI